MQNRSEALQVLGFSEEAGRQEIENRYLHLVKKYKHLAPDEQPTLAEPIFKVINEAYCLLIGYAPLRKIQFSELNWKEKLQHIREYYWLQITACLVLGIIVFGFAAGAYEINKLMKAGITKASSISTTSQNQAVNCRDTTRTLQ